MQVQKKFSLSITSLWKSWKFVQESFADEYKKLSDSGRLCEHGGGEFLWQTSQKYVLKIASPAGRNIVFKSYRKIRDRRKYLFRLTPCGLEAANYQILENAGFPMAKLLSVGEERIFLFVKNAFLITEFAEGYYDGKVFLPGKFRQEDWQNREEFIIRNLQYLAKLHDSGFLHQGFMPGNLLWKKKVHPEKETETLDLIWIDVATCRKVSPQKLKQRLGFEIGNFFRHFNFTDEEILKYLECYMEFSISKPLTLEQLYASVKAELMRRAEKKSNCPEKR